MMELLTGRADAAVFRLTTETHPRGVIAKAGRPRQIIAEAAILNEVLPHVDVAAPHFHGFAMIGAGELAVVFMDDAGNHVPDPGHAPHAALAGEWLAAVHTATARMTQPSAVPLAGPDRYVRQLESAVRILGDAASNQALGRNHVDTIERVVRLLSRVDEVVPRIREVADMFPTLLVHGDFMAKNLRLVKQNGPLELLPFDWDAGGWGSPLPDLAHIRYGFERSAWDGYAPKTSSGLKISTDALEVGARAGLVVRMVAAIYWASINLAVEEVEGTIRDQIEAYEIYLIAALDAFGGDATKKLR